jgi:hypothetical protein
MMKFVRYCFLLLFLLLPSSGFATTVNVAVPSFSMSLVAFMAAKERGYYRRLVRFGTTRYLDSTHGV